MIIVANSLKSHGHEVILATCLSFLRDQFLLNPSSELQVSLMYSEHIVADLLLSTTGVCSQGHHELPDSSLLPANGACGGEMLQFP